jgi:hypothetical protein
VVFDGKMGVFDRKWVFLKFFIGVFKVFSRIYKFL